MYFYCQTPNHWDIDVSKLLISPLKSLSQLTFLFKPNVTMNYHENLWSNNERNNLDSYFSSLKQLLEAFKFIYILKII